MCFEFTIYDYHFRTLCVSGSILPGQIQIKFNSSKQRRQLLYFSLGVAYSPQTLKLCSPPPVATLEVFQVVPKR